MFESVTNSDETPSKATFKHLLRETTPRMIVTPVILGLNMLYFGVMALSGVSFIDPTVEQLVLFGANFGPLTLNGEWIRILTCTFIHIGFLHLLLNMWFLWNLGSIAERAYGNLPFLLIYIMSGLGGSILSLWWNPTLVSAGASGAVFGIAGALITFLWLETHTLINDAVRDTRNSMLAFVGYNLFSGFTNSGIDNAAHIGGLAVGLAMGALLHRSLGVARPRLGPRHGLGVVGILVLLVIGGRVAQQQSQDDPTVVTGAGDALWMNGDIDGALVEYQRALELGPDLDFVHYNLGSAYLQKERFDEAISSFQRALELAPNNAATHADLGLVYSLQGRSDDAIASILKALELNPDLTIAHDNLGDIFLETGRFGEAVNSFQRVLELSPSSATYNKLGLAYFLNEDVNESESAFERALEITPGDALARRSLGGVRVSLGRIDEGIADYRKAIDLDPDDSFAHRLLGEALNEIGYRDEAVTSLVRAADLRPEDAGVHNLLSFVLAENGEYERAVEVIDRALMLEPTTAYLMDTKGTIFFLQGDFRRAATEYRNALALTDKAVGRPCENESSL
jgi:rhomboid protease GluP